MSAAFYMGVDISKNTLSVILKEAMTGNTLWSKKDIANNEKGFSLIEEFVFKKILAKGYKPPFNIAIGMESTGVYGERMAHYFNDKKEDGFIVYMLNPASVRSFAKSAMVKNKNDTTDAQIIASYLSVAIVQNIVSPWVAASDVNSILSALSKRREELVKIRAAEFNRVEKLQNKVNPPAIVLDSIKRVIEYLSNEILMIEKKLIEYVNENPDIKKDFELMCSIPGIGEVTAITLYSETGGLCNFSSAKQLTAFIGLSPEEYSSGTSVYKKPRISKKGNSRIRRILYLCAMVAIKNNPIIVKFYERLISKGKCKKVALVACMRKLLHILWAVVKQGKAFNPEYPV